MDISPTIRLATAEDCEGINFVSQQHDLETGVDGARPYADPSYLSDPNRVVFVTEIGGKIVGFYDVYVTSPSPAKERKADVEHSIVLKEYRRFGLRTRMHQAACGELKGRGINTLLSTLDTAAGERLGYNMRGRQGSKSL